MVEEHKRSMRTRQADLEEGTTEAGQQFSETWCGEEGHLPWVEEGPEGLLSVRSRREEP